MGIVMKFVFLLLLCVLVSGEVKVRCIKKEREALLSFKNGLTDDSGIISSWGRSDECCEWYGVVCSNTTRHVISLELGTGDFAGVLGGEISSSLLELQHLTYLDLSWNDFGGNRIPEFIGSMKQLQHLFLYYSNFAGIIPPQLGNLTNLRSIDLSHNSLTSDNLDWLSNLSLLSLLDLRNNYFGGHSILEFIGSMKQLQRLFLSNSNLAGIIPPRLGNLTNLRSLDLSYNSFTTDNLDWLSSLSLLSLLDLSAVDLSHTNWLQSVHGLRSLQNLNLQSCNIIDVNPSVGLFINSSSTPLFTLGLSDNHLTTSIFDRLSNISTSLVKIDLSGNALGGMIPNAFERLNLLEYLDLSSNMLSGGIPDSLGNETHMRVLVLYDNSFRGYFDEFFGNASAKEKMASLKVLDLDSNKLNGPVPDLGSFSTLTELYLGNNKFTGYVPLGLGQLSKLEVLDLSNNNLEGTVSESHLINFDRLKVLGFSSKSLKIRISDDWNPPFQLDALVLAGCFVGPTFPRWIQSQKLLRVLDLSHARIIDEAPKWLWSLSLSLKYLVISDNQISGIIPDLSATSIEDLDVSSNNMSGPIPLINPNIISLQLSHNMFSGPISNLCKIVHDSLDFIDLSNNQLSGHIPDCWEKMPFLHFLNLASNSFWGEMPHSLGSLHHLYVLQLRANNLSGQLPSTLQFCHELELIDVGGNKITGYIPSWIGGNTNLCYLNFRSNRFYGSIPSDICSLTSVQILDMSRNNLSGKIPNCLNNLSLFDEKFTTNRIFGYDFEYGYNTELPHRDFRKYYNEFSSFQWKGQEFEYKENLDILTLIDLSSNRLSGNIPDSFSSMAGLISLNLSRNSLTGNIIRDIGQMEKLECLDLSNNQLSGEIPKSLGNLSFLAVLNLSNNSLSGKIPSSTQLQSFSTSSYAGNNGLCGKPMPLCPEDRLRPPTATPEEEEDGIWRVSFMQGFIISVAFGFIVGFWGVVGSLVLKKSWRYAYFNLLDDVGDWFYVRISIYSSKWRRS